MNLLAPALVEKVEREGQRRTSLRWFHDRVAGVDESVCFYCGAYLASADQRHVDHVIPWTFLLADPVWNLVLACARCNLSKSDRLPERRFIENLEALNARRAFVAPALFGSVQPLPVGGLAQLFDAASSVEWPHYWSPS